MTSEANREKLPKMTQEVQFGIDLARKISIAVRPIFGIKEKDVPVDAIAKDYHYQIDQRAEAEIKNSFEEAWRMEASYGYVTESQGLVLPPSQKTEIIFMIDPIDGSRPAQLGAEMACVTLVGAEGKVDATFNDGKFGVTHALKEDRTFISRKGQGVSEVSDNEAKPLTKRSNLPSELKDCSLVMESYSMSLQYIGIVMDPLVAEVSFKTDYPSGSYSALTLARGANEIHVDARRRLVVDYPPI